MKTRKGFVQGLNVQAVITEQQIIVAENVTQEENDKQKLHPMLERTESNRKGDWTAFSGTGGLNQGTK
jgi:hypothetical protein